MKVESVACSLCEEQLLFVLEDFTDDISDAVFSVGKHEFKVSIN